MADPKRTVYLEGLNQLRRKLKPIDALVAEPWRKAMTEITESGAEGGRAGAPYKTGGLRAKIYARVQKKPMPMWSAVRSRAKRKSKKYPRGYPYPRLLEFSPKHGHAGQFYKSVAARWGAQAEMALAKAGDEIVRNWGED